MPFFKEKVATEKIPVKRVRFFTDFIFFQQVISSSAS